jgi:ankyrin repeat protein
MKNTTVILSSSPTREILAQTDPYRVLNCLVIYFNPSVSLEQIEIILNDLRKMFNMQLAHPIPINGIFCPINSAQGNQARQIIEYLLSIRMIAAADRPYIQPILDETDKTSQYAAAIDPMAPGTSPAQEDLITSIPEVYIDDIIEECRGDYTVAIKLLRTSLCFHRLNPFLLNAVELFLDQHGIRTGLIESIIGLGKFCNGEANMEKTYLSYGKNLPSQQEQRIIIVHFIIKKLKEKFTNLDDEHQLYMILGITMFRDKEQSLSSLEDTDSIIATALSELEPSPATKIIFGPAGILSPTTFAFSKMGILTANEPDIGRIELLANKFKSTQLFAYLRNLGEVKQESTSKIWQGLKINDKTLAKEALDGRVDVNKFFQDSRTPLIIAAAECDVDMVRLVLKYNPDINKFNKMNAYTALGAAIAKPNASVTELLLKEGAELFTPCGILPSVNQYRMIQSTRINPVAYALFHLTKRPSVEAEKVLCVILNYGGGIGCNLDERCAPFLNKVVMFGGSCSVTEGTQPITTFVQFRQCIFPAEFSYWQKTLKKALNTPSLHFAPETRNEIQLSLDYIATYKPVPPASSIFTRLSPITCANSMHDILVQRLQPIINQQPQNFSPFAVAIGERAYGKALRRACTCNHPLAIELVRILIEYKDLLPFDINEQAGDKKRSAAHYAALSGNSQIYEVLVQQGADITIKDSDEFSAADYYHKIEPNTTKYKM